jgi:hypothetical protein
MVDDLGGSADLVEKLLVADRDHEAVAQKQDRGPRLVRLEGVDAGVVVDGVCDDRHETSWSGWTGRRRGLCGVANDVGLPVQAHRGPTPHD